jgi:hypothetical protein
VFLLWFGLENPGVLAPNEFLERLTLRIRSGIEGLTEGSRKQRFLEQLDETASWDLQGEG